MSGSARASVCVLTGKAEGGTGGGFFLNFFPPKLHVELMFRWNAICWDQGTWLRVGRVNIKSQTHTLNPTLPQNSHHLLQAHRALMKEALLPAVWATIMTPSLCFFSPHSNDCNGPCCFSISLRSLYAPLPIIHNLVQGGLLSHLTACVDCIENIKRLNYKDTSRVNVLLLTAPFNVLHNYSSLSQLT